MSDTPTPGQVAFEAYRAVAMPVSGFPDGGMPWAWQRAEEQAAWEAAAQAVLAQKQEETP